jgi:site-specific DNA-methyltransferase (adenine-specific)
MIVHGDCLNKQFGLPSIPDDTFDVCVTSPPYNLGISYNTYNDKRTREEYLEWVHNVFAQVYRVLKPQGHLFLNMGYSNKDPWIAQDVAGVVRGEKPTGFVLQNSIIWVKSIYNGSNTTGHFKPINSQRFITPTWEHLYHFTKTGNVPLDRLAIGVPYEHYEGNLRNPNTAKTKPNLRCRGNTWFVPYDTIQSKLDKGKHPATFPIKLVDMCLRLTGIKAGSVLDPFMGTGTTAVAAHKLDWSYHGYEIDKEYASFARQRVTCPI